MPHDDLILSELDHARLKALLPRQSSLHQRLDQAELQSPRQIDADVVTMRSELLLQDPDSGLRRRITLAYPAEALPADGQVSVLSPLGQALLGQRVGDLVAWQAPQGPRLQARIAALLYQPEAAGDYLR